MLKQVFEKGVKYVKENPGRTVGTVSGLLLGLGTGGVGLALLGTAISVPGAVVAAGGGAAGAKLGGEMDKRRRREPPG